MYSGPGIYRHYKAGKLYFAIGEVRHSETGEVLILYCPLYLTESKQQLTVRPKKMFDERVPVKGEKKEYWPWRFQRLD